MHAPKVPPKDVPVAPVPSARDGIDQMPRGTDTRHDRTRRGAVFLSVASLGVMLPWPLVGLLLTHRSFDHSNEACLLFGGVTAIPLMILALFGVPEMVWLSMLMLVWIAAALVPAMCLARRERTRAAVVTVLIVQSTFSLAQALLGALMIVGKNV